MITSSIKKYIENYRETNGRAKTRWNGAKNGKNIPKFIPGDKKDVLLSFFAIFDP